jgi:hypothetical protein
VCGEGEPTREERTIAYGNAPLRPRRNRQPSPWRKGPGPRIILLGRRFLGAEKSHRRSRQYRVSSGPLQKTKKVNFQNQCSGIEAPRAWPSETIKYGSHGSVSRGDRRDSWRKQAVITTASMRKQHANRQSNFGPTCGVPVQSIAKQYARAARCTMSIITYALPGKLPLHANTTQIADVSVQEDCSSNSKYYIHYIPGPTCRGPVPLYAPP